MQSAVKIKSAKVVQDARYPRHELTTGGKNLIGMSSLKGYVPILSRIQLTTVIMMIVITSYSVH